jgi:hypothetical protein
VGGDKLAIEQCEGTVRTVQISTDLEGQGEECGPRLAGAIPVERQNETW